MSSGRQQLRERKEEIALIWSIMLASLSFFVSCANPGPAKPPSLHLPALVKDLQAKRSGDHVELRWTTPSGTTDDMEIQGAMTAEICREVGAKAATPVARATACAPVRRLPVSSGMSEVNDLLPPELQAVPPVLLTYRIQIYNSTGHSAGKSTGAYAPAGPAPPPVELLRATASEHGAILAWSAAAAAPTDSASGGEFVDLWRTDLSTPVQEKPRKQTFAVPARKAKRSSNEKTSELNDNLVQLRAVETGTVSPGTVDSTATMGQTYSYVAERVRKVTVENQALEIRSAPSAAVTLAMLDTFPPKVPVGLAAISGFAPPETASAKPGVAASTASAVPYVDLSWEANSEPDLAGYRVYRQLARPDGTAQGPLARLTALPVAAPAYRDVAVKPGQGYIYSVTAVDAAGNESAPSAKALEVVSPENSGSSSLLSPYPGERIAVRWFPPTNVSSISPPDGTIFDFNNSEANDKGA